MISHAPLGKTMGRVVWLCYATHAFCAKTTTTRPAILMVKRVRECISIARGDRRGAEQEVLIRIATCGEASRIVMDAARMKVQWSDVRYARVFQRVVEIDLRLDGKELAGGVKCVAEASLRAPSW